MGFIERRHTLLTNPKARFTLILRYPMLVILSICRPIVMLDPACPNNI